jgi:acyl-CoA hydrolase
VPVAEPPAPGSGTTRFVEVVFPQHLNHHGNLFGGEALRMMDTAAFVAATRRARRTMVTVAVEHVAYEAPVGHGEIVEIAATIDGTGRSSVTVAVELIAEALLSGERRRCGNGRFVFAAVDEHGRSVAIASA